MINISPSAIAAYDSCPLKYKLIYLDKLSEFKDNIHSAYGKVVHEIIQEGFKVGKFVNTYDTFVDKFNELVELHKIDDKNKQNELIEDSKYVFSAVDKLNDIFDFSKISNIKCEDVIIYPVKDDWQFKGKPDLEFEYKNKYNIIDIKTSKAMWPIQKLNNISITSQLILYKHYRSIINNIDPNKMVVRYMFVKYKSKKNPLYVKTIPSGPKSTERATNNMLNCVKLIESKKFNKKFTKLCKWCEFNETIYCPMIKNDIWCHN